MLLDIKQLCQLLQLKSPQGTRKLLKDRLQIPLLLKKRRYYFDTSKEHPFASSILLQYQMGNSFRIIYTIKQLCLLFDNKDKKTVLKILEELGVPLIGLRKKYVFLSHLEQSKKRLRNDEKQTGKLHQK